jgi:hypothetical protein
VRGEPTFGNLGNLIVPLAHARRNRALDSREQRFQRVGKLRLVDVELGGDHAATDVDTNRRRNYCARSWDDRTNRGTDTDVRIGHERDVTFDDRQARGLFRLNDRSFVDVGRP